MRRRRLSCGRENMERQMSKENLFVIVFMTFGVGLIIIAYRKRRMKRERFKIKKNIWNTNLFLYDNKEKLAVEKLVRKYYKKISRTNSKKRAEKLQRNFEIKIGEIPTKSEKSMMKRVYELDKAHKISKNMRKNRSFLHKFKV